MIAGGNGFLGRALIKFLTAQGDTVTLLTRNVSGSIENEIQWDGRSPGDWERVLEGADAVINLAGAPITLPWTPSNRKLILESRVDSTLAFGRAVSQSRLAPKVWINASAVGYYGDRGDTPLPETANKGTGFLAEVCEQWENAVTLHPTPQTKRISLRTGIVLGTDGGALVPLMGLTKAFLGGPAGDGKQYMAWIHLQDHIRLVRWLVKNPIEGPVNACAPHPVTNSDFMHELRRALGKPIAPPAPAFVLRLLARVGGPDSHVLLDSTRAIPEVALSQGFDFVFPSLGPALASLLAQT